MFEMGWGDVRVKSTYDPSAIGAGAGAALEVESWVSGVVRGTPLREELAGLADAAQRLRRLRDEVRDDVADLLGVVAERVDTDWPLADLGFDSMMTMDLKNRLQRKLGVRLSTTLIFGHPTLDRLAPVLLRLLGLAGAARAEPERRREAPTAGRAFGEALATVEALSDEEARRLLEDGA